MKQLLFYIELILDKLYSLYFCLRCFAFKDAIKLPVSISHHVSIGNVYKGCILFDVPIQKGLLLIGHHGFSAVAEQEGLINIDPDCKLILKGTARFGQGIRLWIENGASIELGDNFYCNKNCLIRANENMTFGKDALVGWNVEFNTTDGHDIYVMGNKKANSAPITIGNKVWIASHAIISKGVHLADNCVVAQCSVVTKDFDTPSMLVGGVPAKTICGDVSWEL